MEWADAVVTLIAMLSFWVGWLTCRMGTQALVSRAYARGVDAGLATLDLSHDEIERARHLAIDKKGETS